MTQSIQITENYLFDTSKQVFLITGSKDGYVTGVLGNQFVMRINEDIRHELPYTTSLNFCTPDGFVHAENRIAQLENNERRSAAISRARKRMGNWYAKEQLSNKGLATLRLQAGLSQTELAKRLNMQQPNLSRLEKGLVDPKLSTLQDLAKALGVELAKVAEAASSFCKLNTEA